MRAATTLLAALALGSAAAVATPGAAEDARFRAANERVRAGDHPKAIAGYAELAGSGVESASLYWNWAQAAAASGSAGEALWALLRARELDPADRAVARDVERLRESLNLDAAEIEPEPLAAAARIGRRYRLDLAAAVLLVLSLPATLLGLRGGFRRRLPRASLALVALGAVAALPVVAGGFARPTAAVVRRGAPLYDAASPVAEPRGVLREGEVVPVLDTSGEWLRVEDNAGARGWARSVDVRRLDVPPAPRVR